VAMGRPEEIAKVEESHTGRWLAPLLARVTAPLAHAPEHGIRTLATLELRA